MGKLFNILYKNRSKKRVNKSFEISFFRKYKKLLIDSVYFSNYADNENIFDIIKANIIIKGLINKNTLDLIIEEELLNRNFNTKEDIFNNIKKREEKLPYLNYGDDKIYIPFFNKATNKVYSDNFDMITKEPYIFLKNRYESFIVSTFETYNAQVFDSPFTRFVKILEYKNSIAFFDYDLNIVFVVNNQGYLDNMICLFDKYLKKINKEHILERIKLVLDNYFSNDLTRFIYSLYEQNFISYRIFKKLCKIKLN